MVPFCDVVYTQLPTLDGEKGATVHMKKLPRPSQLPSYTPLQLLPSLRQAAWAAARVLNAVEKLLPAQCLSTCLVHETVTAGDETIGISVRAKYYHPQSHTVQYITTHAIFPDRGKTPTITRLRLVTPHRSVVEEPGSARLTLWGGEDCCVHKLARRTRDRFGGGTGFGLDAALRCGGFEES